MSLRKQRKRAFAAFVKQNRRAYYLRCKALVRGVELDGFDKVLFQLQLASQGRVTKEFLEMMLRIGRDQAKATPADLLVMANAITGPQN